MANMPKITLGIPTMKRFATFLDKNLDLYLANDLWDEIVVVDETGEDYDALVKKYGKEHPRIKLFKNQKRLGAMCNKLEVISKAKNDIVCLMDSDNFAGHDYLQAFLRFIKHHGYDSKTIYMPEKLIGTHYDFSKLPQAVTADNWTFVIDKENAYLNVGNYIVPKSIVTPAVLHYARQQKNIGIDVLILNHLLVGTKKYKLQRVPTMQYQHVVHQNGFYDSTAQECVQEHDKYRICQPQELAQCVVQISDWYGRFGNNVIQVAHAIEKALDYDAIRVELPAHELFNNQTIIEFPAGFKGKDTLVVRDNYYFAKSHRQWTLADERTFYRVWIWPLLKPEMKQAVESQASLDTVIHLRSGDVRSQLHVPFYAQPCSAFYKAVSSHQQVHKKSKDKVLIVTEDLQHVLLPVILSTYFSNAEIQCSSLENDFVSMLRAKHLVTAASSLDFAAVRLSRNIQEVTVAAPFLPNPDWWNVNNLNNWMKGSQLVVNGVTSIGYKGRSATTLSEYTQAMMRADYATALITVQQKEVEQQEEEKEEKAENPKVIFVAMAIGDKYLQEFNRLFRPNLEKYIAKHGYDVRVETELIDKQFGTHVLPQMMTLQKLLLCSQSWSQKYDFVVWIDADILVNINSPAIHTRMQNEKKIGIVDEYAQPTPADRIMFQKHHGWEDNAPDYYKLHGGFSLPNATQVLNVGMMVMQPKYHRVYLEELYNKVIQEARNPARGFHYEQSSIGYHLQQDKMYTLLPAEWNRIWAIYRDLHRLATVNAKDEDLTSHLKQVFGETYFLHFAGHTDFHKVPLLL